jgi:lysophospholipase L1-like esterase
VCAQYPQCHDDGNAWRDFDELASGLLSPDGNHLASAGQAEMAELAWPAVEQALAHGS